MAEPVEMKKAEILRLFLSLEDKDKEEVLKKLEMNKFTKGGENETEITL